MTPEDTFVESAKRLTEAVTANSKSTKSEQMVSLKQLEKMFKNFAEKNAQEVADKQRKTMESKLITKSHNQGWLSHNQGCKLSR